MSQTPSQILENLQTALPAVAKVIKGGWDNIQNFAIKTNSSVSLPIWSCTLDETEGGRWNGLQVEKGEEDKDEESEGDSEEEEEVKAVKDKQASGKGRKRASNSDEKEEESEKPRKKSKATDGTPTTKVKAASPLKASKPTPAGVASSKKGKLTTLPPKASENFVRSSISKEEMKQKRNKAIGEKKKKIMISSKGGKSVKNAMLGKKVAQE